MNIRLAGILALPLLLAMITPAFADVDVVGIDKEQFSLADKFTISGTIDDEDRRMLTAVMKGPNNETLIKNQRTDPDGTFSFIPVQADLLFKSRGDYTITVFTELQPFNEGTEIKLRYENNIIFVLPDYTLELKEIPNKVVNEGEELTFTASVTDSSIEELEFILEKRPDGATIEKTTGKFSWIPTYAQSGGYIIDVIVMSGPLEDTMPVNITVNDKPQPTAEPATSEPKETEPKEKEPEPKVSAVPQELEIPAAFVDDTKDPQSYVDRYNSDVKYKEWFDKNYSEYSSIYEAVGLEEPKETPSFVDENIDPQHYVDRYNNEPKYKEWFDKTYPDMTIYEAVGLEEQTEPIKEEQFGICGEGTRLIEGVCEIFDESEYGQCGEGTKLVDGECTIISKIVEKPWWQFW